MICVGWKQFCKMYLHLKGKGMFYLAQYPVCWTAQSALHFTPGRPVHSGTNSTFLRYILSSNHAAIMHGDYSLVQISTTAYNQVARTKMPKLRNSSKEVSNPEYLDCESGIAKIAYIINYLFYLFTRFLFVGCYIARYACVFAHHRISHPPSLVYCITF